MTVSPNPDSAQPGAVDCDVAVIGAGLGGIYAVHRFRADGLSVRGLEGAGGVGGVWHHNRYPGARVDVESLFYCYYFSRALFDEWQWSERYATQPELLAYLEFVADKFDIRRHFTFNSWLTGAQWCPEHDHYRITTSTGEQFTARFLVMTTGNLSQARKPAFPGLDDFRGEWLQTSHWPATPVALAGKRIGIIGTGASGVQAIPHLAAQAGHLHVFQRTANFVVPAQNGAIDRQVYDEITRDVAGARAAVMTCPQGSPRLLRGTRPASALNAAERLAQLEKHWAYGGHAMNTAFSDQNIDPAANAIVAEFVRDKIRAAVRDQQVARKLLPHAYPIGTRRLGVGTDYYETFNRPNVTLVDVRDEPIVRITERGIQTAQAHYDLDMIIFALGFHAFTGAIDGANIRNEHGQGPSDTWTRGPRTFMGLMTAQFPNFFMATGPGSPAVLANMFAANEQHVDFIADCIAHMRARGHTRVEPSGEAQEAWAAQVAEAASVLLRLKVDNYMVHVNADGERVFVPYAGGFGRYVACCEEVVRRGFAGLRFDGEGAPAMAAGSAPAGQGEAPRVYAGGN